VSRFWICVVVLVVGLVMLPAAEVALLVAR
jgi:hypothetical protein